MSLRGYFALVEAGTTALPRSELARRLGADAHAVLAEAGLVRAGRAANAWPCDHPGRRCGREIVECAPASATPFAAVCEGSCEEDDPCAVMELTAQDLTQSALAIASLAQLLQRIYRLEGDLPSAASLARPTAHPLLLGVERDGDATRDVFFVARPGDRAFPLFLEVRARASRPTLVLVPTAKRLAPELVTQHAPGAHVEVEVLEDTIAVRERRPVRVAKLRLVSNASATPTATPSAGLAAEIGATAWKEIRITVIDGHTLRLQCGKTSIRRTYVELGFGGRLRDPIAKWKIVLAVCAGRGTFRWREFGVYRTAKNAVSVTGKILKASFGLEDSPFHPYNVAEGWRTKFAASSQIEEE